MGKATKKRAKPVVTSGRAAERPVRRAKLSPKRRRTAGGIVRASGHVGVRRAAPVQVKLFPEERDALFRRADARRLSVSGYLRELVNLDAAGAVRWPS